jgi:hypothetical protein
MYVGGGEAGGRVKVMRAWMRVIVAHPRRRHPGRNLLVWLHVCNEV